MTFPERLVELRIENGYSTRAAFAEKIGIPVTTLKHYEDGDREPGHTFLKKISELFNVSIDYLLGLTDEKEVLRPFRVTVSEQDMIEKYRSLDSYGSELVDKVIDVEYRRCQSETANGDKIAQFSIVQSDEDVEKEFSERIVARNGKPISTDDKRRLLDILNNAD